MTAPVRQGPGDRDAKVRSSGGDCPFDGRRRRFVIRCESASGQAPAAGAKSSTAAPTAKLPAQASGGAKVPTPGQFPPYKPPHTADGKPDFNGIWQAFVTADIDVQDHDAQAGPHPNVMGAYDQWPGGQGIVEGGEIPYRPEALHKEKRTRKSAWS